MDEGEVLKMLKEALEEVPSILKLRYADPSRNLWYYKVVDILKAGFGPDSDELNRFVESAPLKTLKGYPDQLQRRSNSRMVRRFTALASIIEKYELLGEDVVPPEGVGNKKAQLGQFHDGLVRYKQLVLMREERRVAANVETEFQKLRLELQRKYGSLKAVIEEYGSSTRVPLQGGNYECEAFTSAFSYTGFDPVALEVVMDTAIAAVNVAIGNLQSVTLPETSQVQVPEDSAQMAKFLFDKMQFHPKVIEASKSLFETQHYAQAIFEAFKAVNNFVKEKTGILSLDGKRLMGKVCNESDPIIRLNEGRTQSDRDEQEGFKFLFMGAMVGIRNPKAHDNVIQTDPYRTLEYLGFASLLMKRVEEGKVAPLQKDV